MKKALIPALLFVSAAFTPCLRNAVELPERISGVAREVARPLFWHLWDEWLEREIARWTQTGAIGGAMTEWRPDSTNEAVACLLFQVFLNHAFDRALSLAGKKENDTFAVSIPAGLIRRTMEGRILPLQAHLAV
jgi:hypothetical protein